MVPTARDLGGRDRMARDLGIANNAQTADGVVSMVPVAVGGACSPCTPGMGVRFRGSHCTNDSETILRAADWLDVGRPWRPACADAQAASRVSGNPVSSSNAASLL